MICVQSAPSVEFLIDSICCYFKKQLSKRFLAFANAINDDNSVSLLANALRRIVINNSLFKYFCTLFAHICYLPTLSRKFLSVFICKRFETRYPIVNFISVITFIHAKDLNAVL